MNGKVVLITGAARGIGADLARKLAAKGAKVSLVGLEPERLAPLAKELGGAWFECDITKQDQLERAMTGTVAALGGIDVVVANAGIANNGTVAVNPADALARTIEVNLIGSIRTASAALPHVRARKGYFLFVSSASAIVALPALAAYSASKIGVEHFAGAFRLELVDTGVDVGVAHPCWIDTDLVRDQSEELPTFRTLLATLPWPFGGTTTVDACTNALVRAIEKRKRKVYVPGTLAPFAFLRTLMWTPLGEAYQRRNARKLIPQLEADVKKLGGISFGKTSVERSP